VLSILCSAVYKSLVVSLQWVVSTCKSGGWSCVVNAVMAVQKLVALEMLRTAGCQNYLQCHSSVSDIPSILCHCIPM
jgi:hypothetical protein